MFYLYILIIILLLFVIVFYLTRSLVILFSLIKGVPFVPLEKALIRESVKYLKISPGDRFLDIGSGDGRVVFYVAKSHPVLKRYKGVEINRTLVFFSKLLKYFHPKKEKIVFKRCNFFDCNFGKENKIYMYLLPEVVNELMPKLVNDLPKGSIVVSAIFPIDRKYIGFGTLEVKKIRFRGKIKKIFVFTKN